MKKRVIRFKPSSKVPLEKIKFWANKTAIFYGKKDQLGRSGFSFTVTEHWPSLHHAHLNLHVHVDFLWRRVYMTLPDGSWMIVGVED